MGKKRLIIRDKEIIKKLNLKPNKSQRYRLDNFKIKEYYQILAEQQVKNESTTSDNDYKETVSPATVSSKIFLSPVLAMYL